MKATLVFEGRKSRKQPEVVRLILEMDFLEKFSSAHSAEVFYENLSPTWGKRESENKRYREKEIYPSPEGCSILNRTTHGTLGELKKALEILEKDQGYKPKRVKIEL